MTAAAVAAADRPANRAASAQAPATASRPPARATTSHSAGAGSPVSASGVVTTTGSGFHDGPPLRVELQPARVSLPHTTHACGSNASDHGISSVRAASATAAGTMARGCLRRPS